MSKRDSHLSQDSDALLPGKGHSPSYGINDSADLSSSSFNNSSKTAPSVIQGIVSASHKERIWAVAMCSLIACLGSLINGIVIGYSSPTLPQLADVPIDGEKYFGQKAVVTSLFGAFSAIGAMFGGPIAWPLSEKFGRQAALVLSGIPSIIGWVLIANAHLTTGIGFVVILLIGRFLTGLATGWVIFGISVYISEIASAKLKGLFGNCNQLFITFGVLIASVFGIKFGGTLVSYWIVALITGGIVVLYEFLLLFTYETPRWLFSKGKEYQAIHVLKILRGPNANISKEIDRTRHAVQKTYTLREQLMEFKHRAVYFPFIIVLFLMFFQQFSGINAAVFYAVTILNSTVEDSNKANIVATASVGVTQVVATFVAVVLVDFLGRRVLLIVSGSGMALGSALFFVFFIIYDRKCFTCLGGSCPPGHPSYCTTSIGAIGIVGMVIFIASFSLGWGPIPWSIMSELLPNRVRALAGSIATFVNWTFASIVTLAFSHYADAVTSEFAFLSFAIVMVGSVVFVVLFVPETKGRSLEEIQEHFEKGEIFALRMKCLKRRSDQTSAGGIQRDHPSRLSVTSVSGYGED